ncbi:TetR/AcrR family transcriptional regulator [Streptomyces sp. Li-HN-5-11]|uniref:TetR/AcrR family transcriptional regulator n=1 Tax=Streptomyces sp. Li-HN-5-11 TaxID=3075432 RepID=UPI0028AD354D|nr:TetR/AcrR family transcriptional regulator [Streptomyces sp. Li-HN-5-11]WNM34777.1 TetR/AcrR family transcriptional regulator [Streptomyces sp. Li-HN-5-11]
MSRQATGGARRDRVREATVREIHQVARTLLVTKGAAAVTINAVAREMGMSGPSLYHYYASRDALVEAVTADFFQELAEAMERDRDEHVGAPLLERFLAACRAMRAWAVGHPAEFEWIFASPVGGAQYRLDSVHRQASLRFAHVFLDLIVEVWDTRPFPVPDPDELPEALREQLRAYSLHIGERLPAEAVHVYVTCWSRLYGLLCLEVLRQMEFVLTDMEPLFEQCLGELAAALGLTRQ